MKSRQMHMDISQFSKREKEVVELLLQGKSNKQIALALGVSQNTVEYHYLNQAINIPYCHHEKWDGTGYPRGLSGEQIPLETRIFAIVDVWDALTSDRPYRRAWTKEKTLEYIRSLSGTHFDPAVVEGFLEPRKQEDRE